MKYEICFTFFFFQTSVSLKKKIIIIEIKRSFGKNPFFQLYNQTFKKFGSFTMGKVHLAAVHLAARTPIEKNR
jgi:hypothetical protein